MMDRMPDAVVSWSGGKDWALAFCHAQRDLCYRVAHLLTGVNAHYERVSVHGVRVALLEAQASRLGLPLMQLRLPEMLDMADYEAALLASLGARRAWGGRVRRHLFREPARLPQSAVGAGGAAGRVSAVAAG